MKNFRRLFFFLFGIALFMACNQTPKDEYDPIEKTIQILSAIDDEEHESVLHEYIGNTLFIDVEKQMLIEQSKRIYAQLHNHGLPQNDKIYLADNYKQRVDSLFQSEFERDSMDVYVTESFLGAEGKVVVTMYLAETNKGLKISSIKLGESF